MIRHARPSRRKTKAKARAKTGARLALYAAGALLFLATSARAGQNSYLMHDSVSIVSAVTVAESEALRFGNFSVTNPGDNGADIVLGIDGSRTAHHSGSTTITLLNGGSSDNGAQGAGLYNVSGAGGSAQLYVTFTDHTGAAITPGNPVSLTGPPGSDEFTVDSFTFNADGSDVNGSFITATGGGTAAVRVGATLHTKSGASTYAPGRYSGTFELMVSY